MHFSFFAGLELLKRVGWRLAVADARPDAIDYRALDYTEQVAIVLGAELGGPTPCARAAADVAIAIPMHGLVESLNVSVAAAVVLFEAENQRRRAGLYDECRLAPEHVQRKLFEWAHPIIAQRCRDKGVAYPPLTDDGDIATNPFG